MSSYVLGESSFTEDHSYSIQSGGIKSNEPHPAYMSQFNNIICDFLREQGVPGASVCINYHGKPFYRQGYGVNYCGETVTSTSCFRVASISKIFTAMATIQLCQDRDISLDTTVFGHNGILKDVDVHPHDPRCLQITVRHLLQHSAGWDREASHDHVFWFQQDKYAPLRQTMDVFDNWSLVKLVLCEKLDFTPGERHAYSNFGYLLLGLIIERVSGMHYEDYVKTMLRGIGIEDVYVGNTGSVLVDYREVRYYNNKEPRVEVTVLPHHTTAVPQYGSFPMETTGAYGGWVTNAHSLVLLLDCLGRLPGVPRVLFAKLVQLMLAKPGYEDGSSWYGLGLDVADDGQSFGHTGAMDGTSTTVHHDRSGLTWSLLLNSWSRDMDLDGLVKYALTTVESLPFWSGSPMPALRSSTGEFTIESKDGKECVQILCPLCTLLHHVEDFKLRGFMISRINALVLNNEVKLNIIWRKVRVKNWNCVIDVKLTDLGTLFDKIKTDFIVTALEAYQLQGDICYVIVYQERTKCTSSVQQRVTAINSIKEHDLLVDRYRKDGFRQITQSVFLKEDATLISCIFEKNAEKTFKLKAEAWLDLRVEDYVDKLSKTIQNNFQLNYIQFYSTKDGPRISAVWIKGRYKNVYQRHGVTQYGCVFELHESMQSNRPVSHLSAYLDDGVAYFSVIWETKLRKR